MKRYPGYDALVTPKVYVTCSECGRRIDRANVLMVRNDDGTWRCWNTTACAQGSPEWERS